MNRRDFLKATIVSGVALGVPGAMQPLLGSLNAAEKTDLAVYRKSTGAWFIYPSSTVPQGSTEWGLEGIHRISRFRRITTGMGKQTWLFIGQVRGRGLSIPLQPALRGSTG